ncbi:MAG: AAA family ATPase, partial [Bacteroidetes bacterium]|nr:AAA family ATPase [Bacteroidota bacterium]
GARGVGKTTLLLQHIKENFKINEETLFVSLDDVYFTGNTLIDLAENFYTKGGRHLFLDEVHKYPTWSKEIKNIYDTYPELKIVFTGSSILEIYKGAADLSRRAVSFKLKGLSFREYLKLKHKISFDKIEFKEIIENHTELTDIITKEIHPLKYFKGYLESGYYPYFVEGEKFYSQKVNNTLNLILETDLPSVIGLSYTNIYKIKKLLYILSTTSPYKPNITKLSSQLETNRANILQFLDFLKRSDILHLLKGITKGDSILTKPDKVYLENSNLIYALAHENPNIGTVRETFFMNQLSHSHFVSTPKNGDFMVDEKFTFEIGGKNKNADQIKDIKNAFVAADDIETGYENKIPLWLFGFLY